MMTNKWSVYLAYLGPEVVRRREFVVNGKGFVLVLTRIDRGS